MTAAAAFGDFVHGLTLAAIPNKVVDHALTTVRDSLGALLGGAVLPENRKMQAMAPVGSATVIGTSRRSSAEYAATVNGTAGVSLEMDEGHPATINHPAAHILPATLAVAEEVGASGADTLTAFIAGYEVAARIGRATRLREAVHPFGTHAITGAGAAAAKLMGLSARDTSQAILMAAGMTLASSQTAANAGAHVRNVVSGLTNANGILAARLAGAGLTAEPEALEVVYGKIVGEHFDPARLTENLGSEWLILRNYFKVHACSRWNHAPIEAAHAATGGKTLTEAEIDRIVVWTYDPAIRLHWQSPANGFAAKHSIPYNVAVRVLHGTNGIEAYEDAMVHDPDVRALALRTTIKEDPAYTAQVPEVRPARVEIVLKSGRTLTGVCERPPGGHDNPFPPDVLPAKFRALAGRVLDVGRIEALDREIDALPTARSIESLIACLRTQGG